MVHNLAGNRRLMAVVGEAFQRRLFAAIAAGSFAAIRLCQIWIKSEDYGNLTQSGTNLVLSC